MHMLTTGLRLQSIRSTVRMTCFEWTSYYSPILIQSEPKPRGVELPCHFCGTVALGDGRVSLLESRPERVDKISTILTKITFDRSGKNDIVQKISKFCQRRRQCHLVWRQQKVGACDQMLSIRELVLLRRMIGNLSISVIGDSIELFTFGLVCNGQVCCRSVCEYLQV